MKLFGLEFSLPKRRERAPDPPGVKTKEWQVKTAFTMSWAAFAVSAFFLGCYNLGIAGDRTSSLHLTHAGTWIGDLVFYVPLIVGFLMLSLGIPFLAKNAVTWFVALSWREAFWPKVWTLVLCVGVSAAIILSSFSVMGEAIIEKGRGAAVAVEVIQQGRSTLQAQIDGITGDLRDATNNPSRTMAQAASVGQLAGSEAAAESEWVRSYVRPAETARAGNVELLRRATGAARAAGAAVARREALRQQLASSPTIASAEANPETSDTQGIISLMGQVHTAFPIVISVLNDLACLFMGLIAYALQLKRERELATAGSVADFDEAHMIEDHSADAPIDAQPMQPAKEVVRDGITGEEYQKIKPKAYWRKKKGKPQTVNIAEDNPGDETGVFDASRTGTGGPSEPSIAQPVTNDIAEYNTPAVSDAAEDDSRDVEAVIHTPEPTTPAYSAEDLDAVYALTEATEIALPGNEGVMINESEDQDSHVREWEKAAQQGARQLEAAE
jgi:hypothetical protein